MFQIFVQYYGVADACAASVNLEQGRQSCMSGTRDLQGSAPASSPTSVSFMAFRFFTWNTAFCRAPDLGASLCLDISWTPNAQPFQVAFLFGFLRAVVGGILCKIPHLQSSAPSSRVLALTWTGTARFPALLSFRNTARVDMNKDRFRLNPLCRHGQGGQVFQMSSNSPVWCCVQQNFGCAGRSSASASAHVRVVLNPDGSCMNQGVHPGGSIAEPGVLRFDTELVSGGVRRTSHRPIGQNLSRQQTMNALGGTWASCPMVRSYPSLPHASHPFKSQTLGRGSQEHLSVSCLLVPSLHNSSCRTGCFRSRVTHATTVSYKCFSCVVPVPLSTALWSTRRRLSTVSPEMWKCKKAGHSLSAAVMEMGIITTWPRKARSLLIRDNNFMAAHWIFQSVEPSMNVASGWFFSQSVFLCALRPVDRQFKQTSGPNGS